MTSLKPSPEFILSKEWWEDGASHSPKRAMDVVDAIGASDADDIDEQRQAIEAYFQNNPDKLSAIPADVRHELDELELLPLDFHLKQPTTLV